MQTSPLPDHPWQKVATDILEWRNSSYVCSNSRLPFTLAKLSSTMYIICYYQTFKIVFSQQGVPQIFVSDNGPQYSATLFKECTCMALLTVVATPYFFKQMELPKELYIRSYYIKVVFNKSDDPAILASTLFITIQMCGELSASLVLTSYVTS